MIYSAIPLMYACALQTEKDIENTRLKSARISRRSAILERSLLVYSTFLILL